MRNTVDCAALAGFVTEYLDGALPKRQRRAFERHLTGCADCDTFLGQMRQTIALTGRLDRTDVLDVPAPVRDRLLAAFLATAAPATNLD